MMQGPNSGSGTGIYFAYSSGPVVADISIADVRVYEFGGDGVNLQNPIVSSLRNVRSESNGGNGFTLGNSSASGGTSVSVNACYANGNAGDGYYLNNLQYSSLNGCASDSAGGAGYYLNSCEAVALTGCGTESDTGNGFEIYGGYCVSLRSCFCYENNAIAFYVTNTAERVELTACAEIDPTGSATYSIKLDSNCQVTVTDPDVTTAVSYNTTTQVLNDGSGNMTVCNELNIKSSASNAITILDEGVASHNNWAVTPTGQMQTGPGTAAVDTQIARSGTGIVTVSPIGSATSAGLIVAEGYVSAGGLTGATAATRYVGATTYGPPTSGTFSTGDFINDQAGTIWTCTSGGTQGTWVAAGVESELLIAPTGATGETCPRSLATSAASSSTASGTVYVVAIGLRAGIPVNNITAFTSSVSGSNVATEADITHGWYALLDSTITVRAVSADTTGGATAFMTSAETGYAKSVSGSAYTTTYTGLYYIAFSMSVSAGTMPQLATRASTGTNGPASSPVLQGTAGTRPRRRPRAPNSPPGQSPMRIPATSTPTPHSRSHLRDHRGHRHAPQSLPGR